MEAIKKNSLEKAPDVCGVGGRVGVGDIMTKRLRKTLCHSLSFLDLLHGCCTLDSVYLEIVSQGLLFQFPVWYVGSTLRIDR